MRAARGCFAAALCRALGLAVRQHDRAADSGRARRGDGRRGQPAAVDALDPRDGGSGRCGLARPPAERVLRLELSSSHLEVLAEHEKGVVVFVVSVAMLARRIAVGASLGALVEERTALTGELQPIAAALFAKALVLRDLHE